MAGIYIPGMKIPKNCISCPVDQGNYKTEQGAFIQCGITGKILRYEEITQSHPRIDNCPLIPVPDHGRLVDADQQIARAVKLNLETAEVISTMLRTAPTILPADRKEEE